MRWGPKGDELARALTPHAARIAQWPNGDGSDPQLLRRREERVARKRLDEMKRRGKRARAQAPAPSAASHDARVEAILEAQVAFHADALRECDEAIAARKKDVLSVIDFDAVDLKRGRASTEKTASLE